MKPSGRFSQIISAVIRNEYFLFALLLCLLLCLFFGRNLFSENSLFLEIKRDSAPFYQYYPWEKFSRELFRSGYLPLWNPYTGFGFPLLANFHSAVFYPLKVLIHFFPSLTGLDLFLLTRLFVAGFFTYLFSRSIQVGKAGSVLAAVSFIFGGHFMRYLNMVLLNVDICVPILFWAVNHIIKKKRAHTLALGSGALCLSIIGGHPETTFYALLFTGGWIIFKLFFNNNKTEVSGQVKSSLCLLGGILILASLLSAIQAIPFAEYLNRSWNYHPVSEWSIHLNIKYVISLLLPWFYGDSSNSLINTYALIPYFGIIPITLALFTLIKIKSSNRYGVFFAGSSIFFMGFAYGLPGFNLVGFLPIFNRLFIFSRCPVLAACFSIAIMAGIGLDYLVKKQYVARAFYWSLVIIFLFVGVASLFHLVGIIQPINLNYLTSQVGLTMVWLALIFVFSRWYSRKRIASSLFGMLIIPLTFFTLWVDSLGNKALYQNETKEQLTANFIDYLKTDTKIFRFHAFPLFLLPPHLGTLYSLNGIQFTDVLIERDHLNFINFMNEMSQEEFESYFIKFPYLGPLQEKLDSPIFDLINLKYIVSKYGFINRQILGDILKKAKVLTANNEYFGLRKFIEIDVAKEALFQHPPTLIEFPLRIPNEGALLHFDPGISHLTWLPNKGDGVGFSLDLITKTKTERLFYRYIDPKRNFLDRKRWWVKITLDSYRGQEVVLRLITDPGPQGDSVCDWAYWREIRLEEPDQIGKYELVSEQKVKIYKNRNVFPRAFIVPEAEIVERHEEVLKRMSSESFNLRKVIILEEQVPELRLTANNAQVINNSGADIIDYQANKVEIETRMAGEGFLVLSDLYYPGWKAYVDGREERVYRADYLLRAIHLSPGFHKVKFIFDPLSFKFGLWLTIITFFSFGGYLLYFLLSARSLGIAIRNKKSIRIKSSPLIL